MIIFDNLREKISLGKREREREYRILLSTLFHIGIDFYVIIIMIFLLIAEKLVKKLFLCNAKRERTNAYATYLHSVMHEIQS